MYRWGWARLCLGGEGVSSGKESAGTTRGRPMEPAGVIQ